MKRSISKFLCAALSLVMLLSCLPLTAFAAAGDEHVHSDACCAAIGGDASVTALCPGGNHVFNTTMEEEIIYVDKTYHRVTLVKMYRCVLCPYSYVEKQMDSSELVEHSYVLGKCACGHYEPKQ